MAETGPITLVLAGSGETTLANMTDLLNDTLGFGPEEADDGFYTDSKRDVRLVLPAGEKYSNKYLNLAVDWSGKANLPYLLVADNDKPTRRTKKAFDETEDIETADDINATLVRGLLDDAEAGREVMLVLLWGDDEDGPGDHIEELLDLALEAGIPVKDLTQGLDDIKFSEGEEAPAPEPEPVPDPEPAPRRGRGRRTAVEEQKTDEVPLTEPTSQEVAATAKAEILAKKEAAIAKATKALEDKKADLPHDGGGDKVGGVTGDSPVVELVSVEPGPLLDVLGWAADFHLHTDEANASVNLSHEVKPRPLTLALHEAYKYLLGLVQTTPPEATGSTESDEPASEAAEEPPAAPKRSRGRPRADGSPAQPVDPDEPSINVFEDEEGNYHKAGRGRPPKGQKRVKITQAQYDELGLDE